MNEPVTFVAFVGDGDERISTVYFVGTLTIDGGTGTVTEYSVDVLSGTIIFIGGGGGTLTGFRGGGWGCGVEDWFFYFYFLTGFYFIFEAIGTQFVGKIASVYIDQDCFAATFEITYGQVPVYTFVACYTYCICCTDYLSIGFSYYTGGE